MGEKPRESDLKRLIALSRPEFIPANLGSLIIGLAWGYDPKNLSLNLLIMTLLSLLVITVVSLVGAQLNSISDYQLDLRDPLKSELTKKLSEFGTGKLARVIILELMISSLLVYLLWSMRREPIQLAIYAVAVFLTIAYSASPLRLKARNILGMLSLCLALSLLPALFIYYTFTSHLSELFALFLVGQTMTVYSLIIPTDIRDYFGDKAMNVMTITAWLGLSRAMVLASALLVIGASLSIYAFISTTIFSTNHVLMASPIIMVVVDAIILGKYNRLYQLSRRHEAVERGVRGSVGDEIVALASDNPSWITLTTQAIVIVNLLLLAGKIIS